MWRLWLQYWIVSHGVSACFRLCYEWRALTANQNSAVEGASRTVELKSKRHNENAKTNTLFQPNCFKRWVLDWSRLPRNVQVPNFPADRSWLVSLLAKWQVAQDVHRLEGRVGTHQTDSAVAAVSLICNERHRKIEECWNSVISALESLRNRIRCDWDWRDKESWEVASDVRRNRRDGKNPRHIPCHQICGGIRP